MVISAQRLFLSFCIALSALLCLALPTFAQTTQGQQAQQNPYIIPDTNPDVPQNMNTWTQGMVYGLTTSLICQLAGIDPSRPDAKCLGIDRQTGKLGYVENGGGLIGITTAGIALLYTPPTHTGEYLGYLASNFGIAKPSYAQAANCQISIGFCGISPLGGIWRTFLNIVYLLFVIAFAVIGVAIMLRLKIDPRTVMSVENQIPKIIITLLLVTFSFPIAGFMVDMMYVSTYVIMNTLKDSGSNRIDLKKVNENLYSTPLGFVSNNTQISIQGGTFTGFWALALGGAGSGQQIMSQIFVPDMTTNALKLDPTKDDTCQSLFCRVLYGAPIPMTPGLTLKTFIDGSASLGRLVTTILATLLTWAISAFVILVILIALLWALFQVWFQLLKAYVYLLIDIVIAPFWIVAGLIPGSPIGFESWARSMLANLSAFPTTIAMFLLGQIFIDSFTTAATTPNMLFVPPLIGSPQIADALGAIIGIGIILITPKVVEITYEVFKAPTFKYTTAAGQALAVGAGYPINVAKTGGQVHTASKEFRVKDKSGTYEERGITGAILSKVIH